MTKFRDIKSNYSKIMIDNHIFIKEETIDNKLGIINVEMFLKTVHSYKMVNKNELPSSYLLKLSDSKAYQSLSFIEITDFNKYKESLIEKIKEINQLENRVCELFGNIYEVNRENDFFVLHSDEVNEFYKIKMREFNSLMIPYIICDLLTINKNYDNQLFLIGQNLFVQISNHEICSLIQVNEKTGECQIIQVYMIEKTDDEFVISIDIDKKNINKILKKEVRKFIKKLEKN